MAKALEESRAKVKCREKYNSYTDRQRAKIGKYAAENCATKAAAHFHSLWKINMNESMVRRIKNKYLD